MAQFGTELIISMLTKVFTSIHIIPKLDIFCSFRLLKRRNMFFNDFQRKIKTFEDSKAWIHRLNLSQLWEGSTLLQCLQYRVFIFSGISTGVVSIGGVNLLDVVKVTDKVVTGTKIMPGLQLMEGFTAGKMEVSGLVDGENLTQLHQDTLWNGEIRLTLIMRMRAVT